MMGISRTHLTNGRTQLAAPPLCCTWTPWLKSSSGGRTPPSCAKSTLATTRSACASSAMKTREVLVSLGKAQQPLEGSDFWGQHSNNKSLSVRKVASRAKRTMEPNRLSIATFHNVFLFFQQKGSRTHCRLHAASSCGIHLAVPIQHG